MYIMQMVDGLKRHYPYIKNDTQEFILDSSILICYALSHVGSKTIPIRYVSLTFYLYQNGNMLDIKY